MRSLNLYISLFILLLITSCQEELGGNGRIDLQQNEYLVTVSIPEVSTVASRTLGEPSQSMLQQLPLSVLVFDENGFFLSMRKAESVTVNTDGKSGTFKVNLPPSDNKCILHFVLGNVTYSDYDRSDSESGIFSSLTVSGGVDAYWQRIEVDKIKENETTFDQPIKLIRNFAKVSLNVAESMSETGFSVLGFMIVNEVSEGTVAPYTGDDSRNGGFATFDLEESGQSYETFVTQNKGYGGNMLGERVTRNQENWDNNPKYIYECNQDKSANPAYILLKAEWNGQECYYKLDIVATDPDTYVTSYLNLYRNFHYAVTITNVAGAGYSTPDAAMAAAAANNLSASVEVSEVNEIEDGLGNKLWVSDMEVMLVTTNPVTISYEYTVNGGQKNELVKVSPVGELNTQAISKYENDGNGSLVIYPADNLPATMGKQELILATPSGLSRKVTIYVRKPFEFQVVDCDDYVAQEAGAELTLVVRLPENMPTAVFPLTLDIEPVKKTIYPDTEKNRIPVDSKEIATFSYEATITYNDYRKNPTFFFHFKTNIKESATEIKVTNPYFLDENNQTSFSNVPSGQVFGFIDLQLSSENNGTFEGDSFTFNTYQTAEKTLTMTFYLHKEGDQVAMPEHVIEIYGRFLDLENVKTETGTFIVREDNHCILYEPKDIYAQQILTFTITQDYASETLQLSASNHKTATVDYKTPSKTLQLKYTYSSWSWGGWRENTDNINRGTVSIYRDENFSDKIMEKRTDASGYITIDSFVGFSGTDTWYFRYEQNNKVYSTSVTIKELVSLSSLTLK